MLAATGSQAQSISIATLGVSTGTDFNTLVNTGTVAIAGGSPINGVYAVRTGTGTNLVADTGTSNGGNNYSYGTPAGNTDRALGSVGSGNAAAGSFFYGVRFTNNTGSTITSLTVNYVGEQWRNGGNTTANVVAFSYVTGAPVGTNLAAFQAAGTNVTALDFSSPINTATAAALDGNAAANRVAISSTITGLNLANGSEILLRWSDPDHGGADHGLAIDDVFVTAAGAPACVTNPVVANTNDAGAGSLRQAVADACSGSTITFSPAAFATAQTITLTSGQIAITQPSLTISGTGVALLTVDGNQASRIFASSATNFTLSGMTLTRGNGIGAGGTVGGAVLNQSGTLTVRDTRFILNSCNNTGAAIGSASGTVVVERSEFLNNICSNVSGIYLQNGVLDIRDSMFTANVGNTDTIRVSANAINSSVLLTNTTITGESSGNQASALLLEFSVSATLVNCTIVGNSTTLAGGAAIGQSGAGTRTLTLLNNIIVGNTANGVPADFSITADPSSSSNLVGAGPGLSNGINNNQVGLARADVLLSVLGSFGGPTLSMPLLPGSPAIDAGNGSGAPTTDQRGVTRSFVDIGAFESRGFTGSIFSGDFQSTPVNTAFPQPLRVLVTANQAIEPVVGGRVTFTPPAAGASAVLATPVATITGASTAGTTATANGTPGAYVVQLDAAGVAEMPAFDLENLPAGGGTTLQFSAATYSVNENGTSATITVTATPAPAAPVSVNFASSDGTAVAGVDYTTATGTLNFGTGVASQTFSVPVSNDTTVEGNETVNLALSAPTGGATLGTPSTAVLTISNDDSTTITVNAPIVVEGNGGTSPLPFAVSLSNPVQGAISLDYASADGNNVDPLQNATLVDNDYQAASGVVSFPSDSTAAQTINVSVVGDTEVEPNQQLRLALSNLQIPASLDPASFNLAGAANSGTITNDDGTTLSVNSPTQPEGNAVGTLAFTVTLSAASKSPVTVNYASADGTATAGSDYTAATGTLTFNPGGPLTQTVNVTTAGDNIVEANETLTLTLSNPNGALLGVAVGTGTLSNDDSASLTVNAPSVAEGNGGNTPLVFTLSLSAPVQGAVGLTVDSADGNNGDPTLNATVADNDYVALSAAPVSFGSGAVSATQAVTVVGDTEVEPNQGLRLLLSNLQVPAGIPAGSVTLASATANGTINNDDGASLSIAANSAPEGAAGTSVLNLAVTLSAASKTPVTVNFATADGTATAGSDYVATSGILTFAPGVTVQQVPVTINGDTLVEPNETFNVTLSAASGAAIGTATAVGTINNDDLGTLSVADASAPEGNTNQSPGVLRFTVTLSAASGVPVSVDYTTAGGTATSGLDFTAATGTLNFAPGQTSQQIAVNVVPDLLGEPDETLTLTLSNPQPGGQVTLLRATATGVITNDDLVSQIPTLGTRGLLAALLLIGGFGLLAVRRRG